MPTGLQRTWAAQSPESDSGPPKTPLHMQATRDHFLLYTEAAHSSQDEAPRWKFVLHPVGNDERLVGDDTDADANHTRRELLAVVRGLEAIDRPARVTLVTRSRYVSRGIRRHLNQ